MWPRGVTPRLRSGAVAESARLRRCRNGQEELPPVQGQGRPGGATSRPRPGRGQEEPPQVGGQELQPGGANQGAVAAQAQEGLEELSQVEGQEGGGKEIPLIQGKEQRLCFAGAAMKRYPTPKVRETQVRW